MLNAFRHHRNSHITKWTTPLARMDGAQRLSASSEFSHLPSRALCSNYTCSTPFGIIGILTKARVKPNIIISTCSTPFGIIGILTEYSHTFPPASSSAQRLSASSEFSLRSGAIEGGQLPRAQRLSASSEFSLPTD